MKYVNYNLLDYENALYSANIINPNKLRPYMWLMLPNRPKDYTLISVSELNEPELELSEFVEREQMRQLVRVNTAKLDLSVGMHIYKFDFFDNAYDIVVSFYFAYQIQSDYPEKEYVYMKREGDNHVS